MTFVGLWKIYSCLLIPNCTRNHVITFTNSLLSADDWIILSRSKIGLQNCFKKHTSFILRNMDVMLKINPKKTKIMIFQKRSRKSVDNNFKTGNEQTEIVQRYTYLGTRLTPTVIFPISSYNSEVWRMYILSPCLQNWRWIFSNYLEVNNKASNLACKAELGRLTLVIPVNEKIIKYVIYLNNKDNDSIVKQSFLLSNNLHSVNNSGFYSNFMNMVEQNNPSTLDPD